MTEMTPRCQAILGLVIRTYVEKGTPVGSKMVVDSYGLKVSPATIRNEMAVLEEMGYLAHPHTSAGRVPTEKGYRYFVQHLLGDTVLPPAQQLMIRHQFHQAPLELDQWVKLAVAVLAHTTHKAALATAPRAREGKFKHLELIVLRDTLVLMVLVLEGGAVKQEMLTLDAPVDQAELSRISNEYNDRFAGMSALAISEISGPLQGLNRRIRGIMVQSLLAMDRQDNESMYRDGLVHVLDEPEFFEGPQVRQMFSTLHGSSLVDVVTAAAEPLEIGGVQVLIGGEGRWRDLSELSLVLSRYGAPGGASGLLGVLGPTRMTYDRIIGTVRYVSGLMSALVTDWYDGESNYIEGA